MKLIAPDYYQQFRCIAGACRHNCCIGWEIDIDEDTLDYYLSLDGELGERLRRNINTEDDPPHFILAEHERCPFLNKDNLCDLIVAQGEGALCQICDDHPRFYNDYAHCTEAGVGLCCEAAARLILSHKEPVELVTLDDDGVGEDADPLEMQVLAVREKLFQILKNRKLPVEKRLGQILEAVGATLPAKTCGGWADFYQGLEQLDPMWQVCLEQLKTTPLMLPGSEWDASFEQLTHYFLYRHLAGALEADEICARAAFAVLSVRMIRALCGVVISQKGQLAMDDVVEMARMYSSEIEYSDENVEALLQALAGA